MTRSDNIATIRTLFEHLDRQDWDTAKTAFADDYVVHMSGNPHPMTADEFIGLGQTFYTAIPDLTHAIDAAVVDGDDVAIRLTITGTHQHELMGVPGSGRAVSLGSFNFYRFRDGKIAEQWVLLDAQGLMQQIGALPAPAAA